MIRVPDFHNKANNTIKLVTQFPWFPSAYKNYVYIIMQCIIIYYIIALCLKKKVYILIQKTVLLKK